MFIAYTNYPFPELGDPGIVRQVRVIAYDRNKYATVLVGNIVSTVKAGYLYSDKELSKRFRNSKWYNVPVIAGDPLPTRREMAAEKKDDRVAVSYKLYANGFIIKKKTRDAALTCARKFQTWDLYMELKMFTSVYIAYSEDGEVAFCTQRYSDRSVLKTSHYQKYFGR